VPRYVMRNTYANVTRYVGKSADVDAAAWSLKYMFLVGIRMVMLHGTNLA
jgi:hypothetical protein